MKVLQFAFDGNPNNPYLPENYQENSVAYTGTHDNDTLKGWYEKLNVDEKQYVLKSLNIKEFNDDSDKSSDIDDLNFLIYELIKSIYRSKANICIVPLQDFICSGSEARINTPSTLGKNWSWRLKNSVITNEFAKKIKDIIIS